MKPTLIPTFVMLAVFASIAASAGAAHAKTWAELAPAPLASDSAYAALKARPADSLSVGELAWLDVQRDWRKQRAREAERGSYYTGLSGADTHTARPNDTRFATLASKPFADLSEDERNWLVLENAAQQLGSGNGGGGAGGGGVGAGEVIGVIAVAAVVGVVAAYVAVHEIFPRIFWR